MNYEPPTTNSQRAHLHGAAPKDLNIFERFIPTFRIFLNVFERFRIPILTPLRI